MAIKACLIETSLCNDVNVLTRVLRGRGLLAGIRTQIIVIPIVTEAYFIVRLIRALLIGYEVLGLIFEARIAKVTKISTQTGSKLTAFKTAENRQKLIFLPFPRVLKVSF